LSRYVWGTTQKYAIARPLVPILWPIQEGMNLIRKEVTIIEEARFSFDCYVETMLEVYLVPKFLIQEIPKCLL
jgi:hypothetical protein